MSKMILSRLLGVLLLLGLALPAAANHDYTKTKYPIVLVHGVLGFDSLLGLDYWYGTASALQSGGGKAYAANVSSINSTEVRGEQLIDELETLQALHGYTKFNLLGHSHGGLTVRYVASVRPDLVASVSTVGSPNAGTKIADKIVAVAPDGSIQAGLVNAFINALGTAIELLSAASDPQDARAAFSAINSADVATFNAAHPEGGLTSACGEGPELASNGVRYYSFHGTSPVTNIFDITDAVWAAGSLLQDGQPSDGGIDRCSSHWGKVIRDNYDWNHMDEVNQMWGIRGLFSSNPNSVYRAHANRLKNLGL